MKYTTSHLSPLGVAILVTLACGTESTTSENDALGDMPSPSLSNDRPAPTDTIESDTTDALQPSGGQNNPEPTPDASNDDTQSGAGGGTGVTPTPTESPTGTETNDGAGGANDGGGTAGNPDSASAGGAGAAGASGGAPATDPPEAPATWPLLNGVQWADTDGNPIQAHGGGMLKVGEDYYWFGENRNPDGTFFAVSAYRSRDLKRWEHAGDVLQMTSDPGLRPANVERPKVVYNEGTGKYVMWMHWENGMDYGEARAAVASSDTVDGEYTYHGSFRPMQDSGVEDHGKPGYMSRDCTLFVDDDGTGYFLSTSNENYDLHLYELTEDYLAIERRAALLFEGEHREAPALFKRGQTYFLVTSGSTGWDPNQAKYATSSSLTSGWSSLQNVANGNTFYSQSTYVLPVEGTSGTEYLYMGDRWARAWGEEVNASSYIWQPITFPSATSMSMTFANNVHIDTTLGTVSGSDDAFTFENIASGLVLAVSGPANENSSDAIQDEAASATSARWTLEYDGAGYFEIANDSGKVLDVPDESTDAGTHLHLWDGNGGDHQAWRVVDEGSGRFRIRNKNSGLYISVADASLEPGADIEQQSDTGGDEQMWRIIVAD